VDKATPFSIAKREVWEAYKEVKANHGAAGVDEQSMQEFEADLKNNLYRIWNRMSSGSYMPPPILRVDIPKAGGAGTRPLDIPTISDRIAQAVVKRFWNRLWNQCFTTIRMDIVLDGLRIGHSTWLGSDAGTIHGCWISTSRISSVVSTGNS